MKKFTAILGTLLLFIGCGTSTKTEYVDRNITQYIDRNVTVVEYVETNSTCPADNNISVTAGYKMLGEDVVEVTFITTTDVTDDSVLLEVSYDEFLEWITFNVNKLNDTVYRGTTQVVLPTTDTNVSYNFRLLATDDDLRTLATFSITK